MFFFITIAIALIGNLLSMIGLFCDQPVLNIFGIAIVATCLVAHLAEFAVYLRVRRKKLRGSTKPRDETNG